MSHWTSRRISEKYAAFRPTYPPEIISHILKHVPVKSLALDVGCGTGQVVKLIATHFDRVVGVDPSDSQIKSAFQAPNVEYTVGAAESFRLSDSRAANLVTVAQALHWFDIPKFCARILQVMDTNGVLAAWNYSTFRSIPLACNEAIDELDTMLLRDGFWPKERRHIDDNYACLIPHITSSHFDLIETRTVHYLEHATVDHVINYLGTWSGIHRYMEAHPDDDILGRLHSRLTDACGNTKEMEVTFPMTLFLFRPKRSNSKL